MLSHGGLQLHDESTRQVTGEPTNTGSDDRVRIEGLTSTGRDTQGLGSSFKDMKSQLWRDGYISVDSEGTKHWLKDRGATLHHLSELSDSVFDTLADDPVNDFMKAGQEDYMSCKRKDGDEFRPHPLPTPLPFQPPQTDLVHEGYDDREFPRLGDWWRTNTAVRAVVNVAHDLVDPHGTPAPGNSRSPDGKIIYTMIPTRTYISAGRGDVIGPSPEGVHQDGGTLAIQLLLGRENISPDTAKSRVWTLNQPSGPYEEVNIAANLTQHLLLEKVLLKPFEMNIVMDRMVKHEGTPMTPKNASVDASRDMFLIFVRFPRSDNSDDAVIGNINCNDASTTASSAPSDSGTDL